RLLVVSGSDDRESEIRCHLVEVRLSEVREAENGYTALSYAWGTGDRNCEIWIGAHKCLINPNLESALRHLRCQDRPIRLWIDALCINQTDLLERNQQVQQMRSIYAAASETVIYLGAQDGGNTGRSAWNFLERNSSWAWNDHQDRDYTLRDVEIDVLSRPWFRRLWVFQEAVVSRCLSIQCGPRRIAWDDFC
ncbi:HET-domain-containing protein, partial [Cryphonectria parasitica EP155]